MTYSEIGSKYLEHLQSGNLENILSLFSHSAMVHSPLYGVKTASEFFKILSEDTSDSNLKFLSLFENSASNSFAMYFKYTWTLKNNEKISFNVVDIFELNDEHKIETLTIIYDTVEARNSVERLN